MEKSKSEDALQKKKERDRRRREKIKNDPELYRKFREKEQARYQKRKQDKKVLPISELPPHKQKILRKRNREQFRAYYQRLKAKKLETIEEVESEPEITLPELNEKIFTMDGIIQTNKHEASGPSRGSGSSHAKTSSNVADELDINTAAKVPRDPPNHQRNRNLEQCRFCAGFSKNCVDVTDKDRPYLTRYKTALTLNDLSVELDFNDDSSPKTVCRVCDRKLQEMYDFLKQVKEAQDLLIGVRDDVKTDIETIIVKMECKSPTPEDDEVDDNDDIDSKYKILDSITVTETEFVKPIVNLKRKCVEVTDKTQKKLKVTTDVESAKSELIKIMNKEKSDKLDDEDAHEAEILPFIDSETDIKPSEFDLATTNENTDCRTLSLVWFSE